MSKLFPTTKKYGECEVCGDLTGKCRRPEDSAFHLCMNVSDAKIGERINGFICVKQDTGKGWATFVRETDQEKHVPQHTKLVRKSRRPAPVSLCAEERDRYYRQLLAELSLAPEDHQELLKRGFSTQEIEAIGYKSVVRSQPLRNHYPTTLPGIAPNGKALLVGGAGYLCPLRDYHGNIVAMQLRLRAPEDGNRYRWLSSRNQALGIDGENPLTVCHPAKEPVGVAFAEGTGAKPHFVAQKLGYITIGAAGGQWPSSPETLKATLAHVAEPGATIILFPDAGDVLNRHVMPRWKATFELIESYGYDVQFAWWGQINKKADDIDELAHTGLISYISAHEFWQIAEQQTGDVWPFWRTARTFTPDHEQEERYFTAPLPQQGEAYFIRSGLGTGKTHWLIETLIGAYQNHGFLSIGYRNSLLIQFCEDPHFQEQNIHWYHLQSDLKDKTGALIIQDPHSKISCCIDSLPHFSEKDFDDRIVILDEVESVVRQLLQAETAVSLQREKIKELFFAMLNRAALVVCLDGLLSDVTVRYLEKAMPNKKIIRYSNTYTGNRGTVEFLEIATSGDLHRVNDSSPVIDAILSNDSRFAVLSDSQQQCEALAQQLTQKGKRVLRVDSTTIHEKETRAFLIAPAQHLTENQIDVLIYSPSAEAGLNIDIKGWFSDIYALFFGVIGTNAQLQMLARVRDPQALIHVYAARHGMRSTATSSAKLPKEIEEEVIEYIKECAYSSLQGVPNQQQIYTLAERLIALSKSTHFEHEAVLFSIAQHEKRHLRQCLFEALLESGYNVIPVVAFSADMALHKTAVADVKQHKAEEIFHAPNISSEEAQQLSRQFGLKPIEKAAVTRRRLLERLPGIEHKHYPAAPLSPQLLPTQTWGETSGEPIFSAEFVHHIKFENRAAISEAELFWLLLHPDAAKALQQERWHRALTLFTDPDEPESSKRLNLFTYRSRWKQIETLRSSGILTFLDPEKEWCGSDPEILRLYAFFRDKKVQRATGLKPGNATPCEFLGRLLRSLGLKTARRWDSATRTRYYRLCPETLSSPIRCAIIEAVERRFRERLEAIGQCNWAELIGVVEEQETPLERTIEARSPSGISVIEPSEGDLLLCLEYAIADGTEALLSLWQEWSQSVREQALSVVRAFKPSLFEELRSISESAHEIYT